MLALVVVVAVQLSILLLSRKTGLHVGLQVGVALGHGRVEDGTQDIRASQEARALLKLAFIVVAIAG